MPMHVIFFLMSDAQCRVTIFFKNCVHFAHREYIIASYAPWRIFILQVWQHCVLYSMMFLFRWSSEHMNTTNVQYVQSRRMHIFVKLYYSTQKNLKEVLCLHKDIISGLVKV